MITNEQKYSKMQIIVCKIGDKMDSNLKKQLIKKHSPSSKIFKNSMFSFLFGGLICVIGQLLSNLFSHLGFEQKTTGILVTISLIFVAALLTALGVFDKIARYAGAGTLVPVTGFSNAVVSQAMDAKSEGCVLGVGAKIYTVAGPVILFGLLSGVVYGIIYYLYRLVEGLS
jgi:stage V sporulation protein AC